MTKCEISYCKNDVRAIGLCINHYNRKNRGYTNWREKSRKEMTESEKFWSRVNKFGPISEYRPDLGPCWLWTAGKVTNPAGKQYGMFSSRMGYKEKAEGTGAHRVSYFYATGELSNNNYHVDHLCRVTLCVNPKHLEMVPARVNSMRGFGLSSINARKTHCKNEHEFTLDNTLDENGNRKCKSCKRAAQKRYKLKVKVKDNA